MRMRQTFSDGPCPGQYNSDYKSMQHDIQKSSTVGRKGMFGSTSIRFPVKPPTHNADVGKYDTQEATKAKASPRELRSM